MKNVARIQTNEIIEFDPLVRNDYSNPPRLKSYIRQAILKDYSKGIKRGRITIMPDYFTIENGEPKIWVNGDIVEVNEFVKILDKDGNGYLKKPNGEDIIFKIIGRNVRYDGQVLIDLELQEIVD